MFAQEFMRNALIAGSFVGLACGVVGYFVVLRAQVFAGDALSHVAFTGALAAAAFGVDVRVGLFAATILGGLVLGALGDRARADDVVIGTLFAWTLGLGVLFLSIFTTRDSAGNGTAGVRVLFGSIFGLSTSDVRTSVVLALVAVALLLAVARPLLFATLDAAVAAAQGVPVRALGLALPRARRARGRAGDAGRRRAAPPRPARRARRRRPPAHRPAVPRPRALDGVRRRVGLARARARLRVPDAAAEHDDRLGRGGRLRPRPARVEPLEYPLLAAPHRPGVIRAEEGA